LSTSEITSIHSTLAIFKSHVESEEKRQKAITLVQGFRNYLHYHIKASKTYLHIRMRKQVDSLLHGKKILFTLVHQFNPILVHYDYSTQSSATRERSVKITKENN